MHYSGNGNKMDSELKRATQKAKNEYLESISDKIIAFHRTGCYDLTNMKTMELERKSRDSNHTHRRLSRKPKVTKCCQPSHNQPHCTYTKHISEDSSMMD
jgi:hypothetical protein